LKHRVVLHEHNVIDFILTKLQGYRKLHRNKIERIRGYCGKYPIVLRHHLTASPLNPPHFGNTRNVRLFRRDLNGTQQRKEVLRQHEVPEDELEWTLLISEMAELLKQTGKMCVNLKDWNWSEELDRITLAQV
jgi:hypothetical protein